MNNNATTTDDWIAAAIVGAIYGFVAALQYIAWANQQRHDGTGQGGHQQQQSWQTRP